ncbi:MAG: sugar phosphate nucleotidyltransferase [Candidatus Nanopelagicales bacterium]|nr:sugar phosphate nucleotidyltransferase [Candidatus Nanopelagicales bacterium]
MRIPRILALVMAGGKGSRLGPLTQDRAKPALPVAGTYRLIDVVMSNLMHSHISNVWVVQQYLPHSLNEHLANGRPWDLDRSHGGLQVLPPYQGAAGEGFAQGNTDALHRHRGAIRAFDPELVLVLSADHLYTLDYLDVVDTHLAAGADLTMVTTEVDEDPSRYGVVQVDAGRVTGFAYKPEDPVGRLVAAEVLLYRTAALLDALDAVAAQRDQLGDYGEDLVPHLVERGGVMEHRLAGYWRDLGTVASYWSAHMELLDGTGARMDDPGWPILTAQPQLLPARIEAAADVHASLVAAGAYVAGTVERSVLGPRVVIEPGAVVRRSVLLDGVHVPAGAQLEQVIADVGAQLGAAQQLGSAQVLTVVGGDGTVALREELDRRG